MGSFLLSSKSRRGIIAQKVLIIGVISLHQRNTDRRWRIGPVDETDQGGRSSLIICVVPNHKLHVKIVVASGLKYAHELSHLFHDVIGVGVEMISEIGVVDGRGIYDRVALGYCWNSVRVVHAKTRVHCFSVSRYSERKPKDTSLRVRRFVEDLPWFVRIGLAVPESPHRCRWSEGG